MDFFVPTADKVGLLPMLVEFTFFVAYISMGTAFVFFLVERNRVAEQHKLTVLISALIVGVAAFHYFYMKGLYQPSLEELATAETLADQKQIVRDSFLGIINFRYMDWLITTPLLLVKVPLILGLKGRERSSMLATLVIADIFMIATGFIGEQQLDAEGNVLVAERMIWGAISTIGYVIIAITLLTRARQVAADSQSSEVRFAVNAICWFVLTGWGIYPLGYLVPALLPNADLNWVHLTYNLGDAVNKIGYGWVLYYAAMRMTQKGGDQSTSPSQGADTLDPIPAK